MIVKKIVNSYLSSNTYILFLENEDYVWLIDPGDTEPIFSWLRAQNKNLRGVLLTHYHYDHIYGVLDLLAEYDEILIYASNQSIEGLASPRMNGSLYAGTPYSLDRRFIKEVKSGEEIKIFNSRNALVYETPGHNNDCITFCIGAVLFTGDALIPGVKPHVRSKHGDRDLANQSIKKIFDTFSDDYVVYPGHKEVASLGELRKRYDFEKNEWIHKS
ncbi:MAG: MBL fold metallo-hydrolase [Bacteroidetes bacterium]|jgi:hydroxyacylglutathione hydrolase|nr:MBL fold metallo-hydrolase [Bacteroidota bacterium]